MTAFFRSIGLRSDASVFGLSLAWTNSTVPSATQSTSVSSVPLSARIGRCNRWQIIGSLEIASLVAGVNNHQIIWIQRVAELDDEGALVILLVTTSEPVLHQLEGSGDLVLPKCGKGRFAYGRPEPRNIRYPGSNSYHFAIVFIKEIEVKEFLT